jgi:hypothetical protein
MEYSNFVSNKPGVCELEFSNDSVVIKFISTKSKIIDTFTITKTLDH